MLRSRRRVGERRDQGGVADRVAARQRPVQAEELLELQRSREEEGRRARAVRPLRVVGLQDLARALDRRAQRHQLVVRTLLALDLAMCGVEHRVDLRLPRARRGEAIGVEVQVQAEDRALLVAHPSQLAQAGVVEVVGDCHQPVSRPSLRRSPDECPTAGAGPSAPRGRLCRAAPGRERRAPRMAPP